MENPRVYPINPVVKQAAWFDGRDKVKQQGEKPMQDLQLEQFSFSPLNSCHVKLCPTYVDFTWPNV